MSAIKFHKDLRVYQSAFNTAMEIFVVSKTFPKEERYSLTDQIRRSSRSVCANITEAWRKRRYPKSFVAKLNDSESEAGETQNWLDFAFACDYISEEDYKDLYQKYDYIIGMLVKMIDQSEQWTIQKSKQQED
ncbi:MAG: four helix bundle protein [Bergeyella sp.]